MLWRENTCAGTVRRVEADDLHAQDYRQRDAKVAGDYLIADRLDALEAERVMQRALELEAESLDQPHVITTQQLERIAKEIGVDQAFVHQALGEVRLAPEARGRISRWILPDDLVETASINGINREDADASITKWMTQNEGLTPGAMLADGVEWSVDRRWRARMLSRSLSGGNRISRVASGDIAHRVHSTSEHEHVVALHSEGRLPLLFAQITMALGGTLAALLLLGASTTSDLLASFVFSLFVAGVSTAAGVTGARWWARGIRAAMRQSLIGLVGSAKAKKKRWFPRRRNKDN